MCLRPANWESPEKPTLICAKWPISSPRPLSNFATSRSCLGLSPVDGEEAKLKREKAFWQQRLLIISPNYPGTNWTPNNLVLISRRPISGGKLMEGTFSVSCTT
ncbi:hypothetical protein NPIL_594721 [Nephila pilipes]|uniref:Uncharacterized protein n=1 Tax=Nephila pilipes TaxID=299642 RepID=A0A8X6UXD6_NEPPI|nr:hypothetical protein NPIL_594721 [Nephila pilipes]